MFIVERRTLGVLAALGVVLSIVELDRLSDVADSAAPRSLSAFTTAIATPLPAMHHDAEVAPPRDRCSEHIWTCAPARAWTADCGDNRTLGGGARVALVEPARANPDDAACRARARIALLNRSVALTRPIEAVAVGERSDGRMSATTMPSSRR
jgi:hypothetical protein